MGSGADRAAGSTAAAPSHLVTPLPLVGIRAVVFDVDETLTSRSTTYRGRIVALLHTVLASPAGSWAQADGRRSRLLPVRLLLHGYDLLCRRVVLDPETQSMLDTLQSVGFLLGIVTNGTARKRHTVTLLGLDRRTSCIVISGEVGRRKPHPAIFEQVVECLGVPAAAMLFVGDRLRQDIAGARDAGMHTVWLRRGHAPLLRRRAQRADHVISSPRALLLALGLAPAPAAG